MNMFEFSLTFFIVLKFQVAFDSNWEINDSLENIWALPVGLFLVSFAWWESFVDENSVSPGQLLILKLF